MTDLGKPLKIHENVPEPIKFPIITRPIPKVSEPIIVPDPERILEPARMSIKL